MLHLIYRYILQLIVYNVCDRKRLKESKAVLKDFTLAAGKRISRTPFWCLAIGMTFIISSGSSVEVIELLTSSLLVVFT